jgi:hypothetical protein
MTCSLCMLTLHRFDPNPNVQRSMNDIWNALVKDSSATIDKHFDAIMDDLLVSILGKEWRVRQAACAAVADLIQGRGIDKVRPRCILKEQILTITSMRSICLRSGTSASRFSTISKKPFVWLLRLSLAY